MHITRKAPLYQTLLFHHCFLCLKSKLHHQPCPFIQRMSSQRQSRQTPVMACDQSLFAILKQIRWISPNSYGEDLYVIMLGGLHIEMTAWKALGKWLDSSGWTSALVQADIATGKADSFLKASHVSRTRHAQKVTAAALYAIHSVAKGLLNLC